MQGQHDNDAKDDKKRRLDVPPVLSREQQADIIELAFQGVTIGKICTKVGISYNTLARCIVRDPVFANEWNLARSAASHLVADQLLEVTENAETLADAAVCRVRSDNIRTAAAWLNPKYSPRQQVEHTHTVDLSKALEQANQRLDQIEAIRAPLPEIKQHHIDRAIERHEVYKVRDLADRAAERFKREPLVMPGQSLVDSQTIEGELVVPDVSTDSKQAPINDPRAFEHDEDEAK